MQAEAAKADVHVMLVDHQGFRGSERPAGEIVDITIAIIVQTAHGGIDNVVSAMRAGATDFVDKPASPERLEVSLRNALRTGLTSNY